MHRNSYAMTTHLALEELGLDYDVTWFNVHKAEEFPAEFLQLNPNARVPLLITPDGPVYESAATMMYLSEKHGGRFMPAIGDPKRGQYLQWMFYLMSSFQPEVLIQFHPERYFAQDDAMQQALENGFATRAGILMAYHRRGARARPLFSRGRLQPVRHAVPDAGCLGREPARRTGALPGLPAHDAIRLRSTGRPARHCNPPD